jgi:hypothetical protein
MESDRPEPYPQVELAAVRGMRRDAADLGVAVGHQTTCARLVGRKATQIAYESFLIFSINARRSAICVLNFSKTYSKTVLISSAISMHSSSDRP